MYNMVYGDLETMVIDDIIQWAKQKYDIIDILEMPSFPELVTEYWKEKLE